MENNDNITAFSNAFRLSTKDDLAVFEFGFYYPEEEPLNDENVVNVATIGMQVELLKVIRENIDKILSSLNDVN